jgi:hypothetical protein
MDQLIKSTSTKISINNVPQHQQASTSTSHIGQQSILCAGNNQKVLKLKNNFFKSKSIFSN